MSSLFGSPPGRKQALAITAVVGVVSLLVYLLTDLGYLCLLLPASLFILYAWLKSPRFWIYSIVASFFFYFSDTGEGASGVDYVLGGAIQGSLMLWLIHRLFVSRQPLFRSMFDVLIVVYFVYSVFNVWVAIEHNTDTVDWLREWVVGLAALYVFPIREHFNNEKDFKKLLAFASIVSLVQIFMNIQFFLFIARNAEYAYQIAGRRSTPFLFLLTALFFLVFAVYERRMIMRWVLTVFTLIATVGVFLTYSRTSMIALILCFILLFFFVGREQRVRIGITMLVSFLVPVLIMPFALGNVAKLARATIVNRLTSSGKGTKDAAVQARIYESRVVYKLVKQEPLSGYGLSTPYNAYNPILKVSATRSYIHNGYLSIVYRFGIVFAVIFYGTLLYATIEGFFIVRRSKSEFERKIALAAFLNMICIVLGSFTDTVFFARSSAFVLAFTYAALALARHWNDPGFRNVVVARSPMSDVTSGTVSILPPSSAPGV
ncbi:MAG: O-antigen ligase family protein [Candidatus Kapaibacterium sp.]|jgi:hypothetical protein